jgi:hypothetical protein
MTRRLPRADTKNSLSRQESARGKAPNAFKPNHFDAEIAERTQSHQRKNTHKRTP